MKQATLITGEPDSGKALCVQIMTLPFENPVIINGRDESLKYVNFIFQSASLETDVIVFEDVSLQNWAFIKAIIHSEKIKVEQKHQEPFTMPTPKIIATLNFELDKEDILRTDLIDFIHCNNDG